MQKKILYVVNNPAYFVSHRLPIAQEMILRGWQVHLAGPGSELEETMKEGIHFHPLALSRRGMNPFLEGLAVFKMWELFRAVNPDIVHLVTMKPNLYGGIAARLSGVPAVISAISGLGNLFTGNSLKNGVVRFFLSPFFRFALGHPNQRIIFQNMSDQNEMENRGFVSHHRCVLIPGSGVILKNYPVHEKESERLVVTFAARLLWDKGIGEFIQTSKILEGQFPDVEFWLVGGIDEGNPESICKNKLEEWKHLRNIKIWGHQNDIPHIFSQSDIVVLPSYREGLPKVLVEAQACGRPVVTTDVPGCRDAIKNFETGLLVPYKDADALSKAVAKILSDSGLREKMGEAARKYCEEEFSIERIVQLHIKTYLDVSER